MKTIKKSLTTIIWILLIALGYVILSNTASKMGECSVEAWTYVNRLFAHSTLFWTVGILIFLQVILLNLKPFKGKTIILIILSVMVIIAAVMFYKDMSITMLSYKQVIFDTNVKPEEIGLAVFGYRKYALIYSVVSSILAVTSVGVGIVSKK